MKMVPIIGEAGIEPQRYRASGHRRWIALAATMSIYMTVAAALFFTITRTIPQEPAPALTVFDMKAPASPEEAPPQEKEDDKPVEKQPAPALPVAPAIEVSKVQLSQNIVPLPPIAPKPVDPAPAETEPAAPRAVTAPPAPSVSGNAPDSWEGRVLAALNRERRYPRMAMLHRQQGVPYIRFMIDREGKVLNTTLERSSGFSELDREAVGLPKRASPLPKPPQERSGDTLELVVPVEFFLRR
ncbi:MAG: TonB family protein [Novosphingobium sp.]